jgi:hypothetical protein
MPYIEKTEAPANTGKERAIPKLTPVSHRAAALVLA